ncbi:MAG: peroxiredoxin-like family protein [Haliscomenobacter sp.]|uniref:peroxiredoxin-like family protein n=1 Tax=Haliscomenobacter sp. TaxID=2717303 RepID=UPI0029AE0995|nr:peroxiredoxin-like family protein [Haliscomenobacter sp.]MDX2069326.1 peroxiredoxin-like family protein [Haliscomenobacter sp.]
MQYLKILSLFLFLPFSLLAQSDLPAKPEDIAPLLIGEMVPDMQLAKMDGTPIDMGTVLNGNKTILIFYRGGWCPYCNSHLSDLQKIEPKLKELGYQIVAVSPDAPTKLKETDLKNDLGYQLYADTKGELMGKMGIAFQAPERYQKMLLSASDEANKGWLPVPSVFIVNDKKQIVFEYISPDFKHRMNGDLLMAVASKL